MHVSVDELDLARFESLLAGARQRLDPEERSTDLREALALWRGDPLADLRYESFAHREIARLEKLRLAALEDRTDADLALGREHALVAELEPLVAESAFRERLRGQLMLALYRCGRQADALHVFQSGRKALVEELGIEPGPALQQLERQILNQDPSLELEPRSRPATPDRVPMPPSPRPPQASEGPAPGEERKVATSSSPTSSVRPSSASRSTPSGCALCSAPISRRCRTSSIVGRNAREVHRRCDRRGLRSPGSPRRRSGAGDPRSARDA